MKKRKNDNDSNGKGNNKGDDSNGKERSRAWLEEEAGLKREALELSLRIAILNDMAEGVMRRVEEHTRIDLDTVRKMGWEAQEAFYKKTEELDRELEANDELLLKLDDEYNALRVRVNEFYGEELLKESDKLPLLGDVFKDMGNEEDEDEDDKSGEEWKEGNSGDKDGDWWKKG